LVAAGYSTLLAIVEVAGVEGQQRFAADIPALAIAQAGTLQIKCVIRDQRTTIVVDGSCNFQRQLACTGDTAGCVAQTVGLGS
jgi:hypothetical protein